MKIGEDLRFIVITKSADSLYSLIADGQHRSTFLGPEKWKSLIGSQGYLHRYCNKEGFNLEPEGAYWKNKACKARIGILANYNKGCVDVDSRIGFGTGGPRDDNNTCQHTSKRWDTYWSSNEKKVHTVINNINTFVNINKHIGNQEHFIDYTECNTH